MFRFLCCPGCKIFGDSIWVGMNVGNSFEVPALSCCWGLRANRGEAARLRSLLNDVVAFEPARYRPPLFLLVIILDDRS